MTGYEPRWDIDRGYGEEAEGSLRAQLSLRNVAFEVKRKRYVDDIFYVEVAQKPQGHLDYVRSGINTSQADYWVYEIGDTGVKVMFPRRALHAAAGRSTDRREETDGANPTKGRLVRFADVLAVATEDALEPELQEGDEALLERIADECFTGPPQRRAA